jgi:hypothetical protein
VFGVGFPSPLGSFLVYLNCQQHIQVLGFADDLNILGNPLEETEKASQALEQAASKIGLKINVKKTKVMELIEDEDSPKAGSITFEKVN